MAEAPESSEYTSITDRITTAKGSGKSKIPPKKPAHLLPFIGNLRKVMPKGLPFNLTDYLELAEWTGWFLREDKRGYITQDQPPILERLQIDPQHWCYLTAL
jgi:hypothetical protein